MPVTVISTPSSSTLLEAAFGTVSVVMIALAASIQLFLPIFWAALGMPAKSFVMGSGSMITPVEKGRTLIGSVLKISATAWQVSSASCKPVNPVPALAHPVLTTIARMSLVSSKCSLQICTGAAANRFFVKTPATFDPGASSINIKSFLPTFLMPASAVPRTTPETGRMSSATGALRLTAMFFPF